jgi:hypothetical protein
MQTKFDNTLSRYSHQQRNSLNIYTEHVLEFLIIFLLALQTLYSSANSLIKMKKIQKLLNEDKITIEPGNKIKRAKRKQG